MNTFFMFGKYSVEAVKGIHPERTAKAIKIIEVLGGKIKGMYAVLGDYDLILIVECTDMDKIVRMSVDLFNITGIHFSTFPAMSVDYFDILLSRKEKMV
jgi:uncharacterized protein with GYD domain